MTTLKLELIFLEKNSDGHYDDFILITRVILLYRKIVELEEELRVVGNNLKSLEVSEEKVHVYNSVIRIFFFKTRYQ